MKHVVSQKQRMPKMMQLLFIIALQLSAMQNINKLSYERSGFYELELCSKMPFIFGSCCKCATNWPDSGESLTESHDISL